MTQSTPRPAGGGLYTLGELALGGCQSEPQIKPQAAQPQPEGRVAIAGEKSFAPGSSKSTTRR